MNRSHMGRRSRQRGYEYEHWLEKNLPNFGFTDTRKQPLSGAIPNRPEMAGDHFPTFYTDDGHVYKFALSAKRTAKTSINFATEWMTEIIGIAEKVDRIPIVMFALHGRPRIINYVVIPEEYFIGMVGNMGEDELIISNVSFYGKKYITMKKSFLENEFFKNRFDLPIALRFEGPKGQFNLLFDLETFVGVI